MRRREPSRAQAFLGPQHLVASLSLLYPRNNMQYRLPFYGLRFRQGAQPLQAGQPVERAAHPSLLRGEAPQLMGETEHLAGASAWAEGQFNAHGIGIENLLK